MTLKLNGTFFMRLTRNMIFITLILFTLAPVLCGQKTREEPPPFRERLFFGGNFGLQFGTITDIQVSPIIGLWVLPRIAVAVGPDYRFYKDPVDRTNIFGGKGYLQFVVIQDINSVIPVGVHTGVFLHLEDELLSLESSVWKNPPITSERFNLNTVLAGGGISQQIGRRASLNIMVLWALNDSGYGVYSNPEIRVSFNF
ncbi:MAG: hypothetical protein NTV31_00125 [Bacteroidia bacterium]|nr:hypothetical protein [Bacteroidia bacterium]MCX6325894.1 hypothetical protein [Bacteroidia bacterium]